MVGASLPSSNSNCKHRATLTVNPNGVGALAFPLNSLAKDQDCIQLSISMEGCVIPIALFYSVICEYPRDNCMPGLEGTSCKTLAVNNNFVAKASDGHAKYVQDA
ncbi:unnamed protein product [Urochloa humidicola]